MSQKKIFDTIEQIEELYGTADLSADPITIPQPDGASVFVIPRGKRWKVVDVRDLTPTQRRNRINTESDARNFMTVTVKVHHRNNADLETSLRACDVAGIARGKWIKAVCEQYLEHCNAAGIDPLDIGR